MGYDLKRETTVFQNIDNHDWLGSAHGVDAADSITLDSVSLLTAYPDGNVPAGIEVSRDTATGMYKPGWAGTGRDKPGFLLHSVHVTTGFKPVGALHWHGEVILSRVPVPSGGSAPTPANHPLIRFV
jgi:hypothetical protein